MIFVRDEILIAADIGDIWNRLVDINNWGKWTRLFRHSVVYGPIQQGAELKCVTGKWDFSGVISEAIPKGRLILIGKTIGIDIECSWDLSIENKSTRVMSQINATGWISRLFKWRVERGLQDALFSWLYALKTSSERSKPGVIPERKLELGKPFRRKSYLGPLNFFMKRPPSEGGE